MDNELLNTILDTLERYNSRLDKAEKETSQVGADIGKISKKLPMEVNNSVAKEVAKIPKPENADYALLKRLMEEDISKHLITHNMTVKDVQSSLEKYIDSIQPTDKDRMARVSSYVDSITDKLKGKDGKDGKSIVGPAGKDGKSITGSKGLTGPKGKDGKDGKASNIEDISFKDGDLCFTVDGRKKTITLPIPQGYGGGNSGKVAAKMEDLRDVDANGPEVDQILSWNGNKWVATNNVGGVGGSGDTYTNLTPVPNTIGGITAGTTFDNVSITEVLNMLLYPYQVPAFTSFSISGQATILEVGDQVTASTKTFIWATSNSTNVEVNTVDIDDVTAVSNLITNTANDATEAIAITAVQKIIASSHTWRITATDTEASNFTRDFTVNWYWRIYYGESALTTLTETDIEALRVNELIANPNKTYAMDAENYKWICYPTAMGLKTTFKDADTNLDVAMNPVETVSITSVFGITQDYYCHRTFNVLGGSINIAVSN